MAQTNFNTSFPNDGLGDKLRDAFLAQQAMNTELYSNKVDKVAGRDLSENNYSNADKAKVDALNGDEEKNVQSDWNELDPTSDAFILGKPIFSTNEIIVSAIWTGTGLNFEVTADAFPIGGVSYPATPETVTLDAADATLDRIDLIVAIVPTDPATVGTVGKITGTPASTALVVPPDYDPAIYYVIKQVTVKAAATTPDGAANTQIYSDAGTWTKTLPANAVENTSDPSEGVNCIEATGWTVNDKLLFTAPSALSTDDLDLLQFDIKLKELQIKKYIGVTIINGTHRLATRYFTGGANGFDYQNLSYQTISLNKAFLNLNIETFDSIEIVYFANTTGFYFDNFKLFKGSGAETVPNTGIPDAPSDGILRGRKNGAWEAIPVAVADMTKAVYDPTTKNADAFAMDNMAVATSSKTTPIDADSINLWDSTGTPIFKKLTWANLKATLKTYFDTLYAPKFGTRITNATVTGTYTLDHSAGNDWKLTLTGDTTFSDSNLPTGTNTIEFTIKLTGAFVPTFPAYWDILGDAYDGSVWNFISVQTHSGTTPSEEVTAFISNF